jgi:hypothetical protein
MEGAHVMITSQDEYDKLDDAAKTVVCLEMRAEAEKVPGINKCVFCTKPFFFAKDSKARVEGHVYSVAGRKETSISGVCEFCFDGLMKGDEDEYNELERQLDELPDNNRGN